MLSAQASIGYGQLITQIASENPDRLVIYIDDEPHSIGELEWSANRLARVFISRGVRPHDIVTIPLPNSFELLVTMLAAWKIGAVPNPIAANMPFEEMADLINCANSALIVGVAEELFPNHKTLPKSFTPDENISCASLPALIEHGCERALASGGSTGKPKLIMPKDKAVFNSAFSSALFKPQRATLIAGPLYHAVPFSSVWQGIFNRCSVVIMPRFEAEKCLQLVQGVDCPFPRKVHCVKSTL